jgi:hypothetical protein
MKYIYEELLFINETWRDECHWTLLLRVSIKILLNNFNFKTINLTDATRKLLKCCTTQMHYRISQKKMDYKMISFFFNGEGKILIKFYLWNLSRSFIVCHQNLSTSISNWTKLTLNLKSNWIHLIIPPRH